MQYSIFHRNTRWCQWDFSRTGGEHPRPPPRLLVVCDDVTPPPVQSGRAGRRQQTALSLETLSPGFVCCSVLSARQPYQPTRLHGTAPPPAGLHGTLLPHPQEHAGRRRPHTVSPAMRRVRVRGWTGGRLTLSSHLKCEETLSKCFETRLSRPERCVTTQVVWPKCCCV